MRVSLLGVVLCVGVAGASPAQAPVAAIRLRGVVVDSLARVRLRGAVVQAVLLDSAWRPDTTRGELRVFASVADSVGAYVLAALPMGRYAVGFQHASLAALGVEPMVKAIRVTGDTTVDLGIPTGPALRALVCSDSTANDGDALVGRIGEVPGLQGLAMAKVRIAWEELSIVNGKMARTHREASAISAENGGYRICGLPTASDVAITVEREGYRPFKAAYSLAEVAVQRLDIALGVIGANGASGAIRGRVVDSAGVPIRARIAIPALGLEASMGAESFSISSVPEGSWMAEVRAVGYIPRAVIMTSPTSATVLDDAVVLARQPQELDTMRVSGRVTRQAAILDGVRQRSSAAGGTTFLPGNSWLATASEPGDVLRAARGFTFKGSGMIEARQYFLPNGEQHICRTRRGDESRERYEPKEIAIYVDGNRYTAGFVLLNREIRADDVLAVETYPDITSAPMQWRKNDSCAVIAIWTKP